MGHVNVIEKMPSTSQSLFDKKLHEALHSPLHLARARPSKKIRAELLSVLFRSIADKAHDSLFEKLGDLVERIHTASIVIDDIEDSTLERRGYPSLHVECGLPVALNAASWLLFSPFQVVRELSLTPEKELCVFHELSTTMLKAHEGQAVDVATNVTQICKSDVYETWYRTAELKTGALMRFTAVLPWICTRESREGVDDVGRFGEKFGIGLQMLDDVSDFFSQDISDDLSLRRLNFVLAEASQSLDNAQYENLLSILKNVEARFPELKRTEFILEMKQTCVAKAIEYLNDAVLGFAHTGLVSSASITAIDKLKEKLIHAFTR